MCKEKLAQEVEKCVGDKINRGIYQFQIRKFENLYLNNCQKGSIEFLCQDLVLRKLYNNIKRIYAVEQSNRNQIVKQMDSLLREDTQKWVVRLDVQRFYESIDRERVMLRFQADGRLNYQSIMLLKNLFEQSAIVSDKGLPRGLSISSVMSELYMKYFDLEIRRMEGVFYYARFVDDIIVFCSSQKSQENVWKSVPKILSEIGLQLNKSKSYKWNGCKSTEMLTYLGYSFSQKGKKDVEITIADKKVKVIKTRITKSFVRFAKDGNYNKLKNRIKFLTGNCTLYNSSTLQPIKVGIFFNYNMITTLRVLYELDEYYQKLLHCKTGKLGIRLDAQMSVAQRTELTKYSFVFGFEHHVNHFFTPAILADITDCWK